MEARLAALGDAGVLIVAACSNDAEPTPDVQATAEAAVDDAEASDE